MSRSITLAAGIAATLALALPASGQAAAQHRSTQLYVSLGDSYATGYQATGQGQGHNTTEGFADQIPALARRRGYRLKLVNFGCGGATTTSILQAEGCHPRARAVGGPDYSGETQIEAAEAFLRANRGRVALVTVSIGGNDVTACARAADPVACVAAAVEGIKTNVGELARRLRAAAGAKVRIVGTTYPDVILGQWTTGQQADQDLARLSVVAFRSLINPALKDSYATAGGDFVDVTAATGAYGSLDETTTLAPYGTIPKPVAEVCRLTYYCEFRDIHARTSGYRVIAKLVTQTLPRRPR
ncbi:MAG TPA: SGNH/GDSL hydrolase family protein [Capillimicrobium sp.]|nr:SGNH/GDSL hydrolase family protein [Capillimicrobium sp.]